MTSKLMLHIRNVQKQDVPILRGCKKFHYQASTESLIAENVLQIDVGYDDYYHVQFQLISPNAEDMRAGSQVFHK